MADANNFSNWNNETLQIKNETVLAFDCNFKELNSPKDLFDLFQNFDCYRHSTSYTTFLCLANIIILLIGLIGNLLVIFVVICRLKIKTASNVFILNLAVADMLVIICCIPTTAVSNLFIPWVFSEATCKVVAYAQGLSVFCSVYSLVAISFDRCKALHPTMGMAPKMTTQQAWKIVLAIWIIGSIVTLPWAYVFTVMWVDPLANTVFSEQTVLPFCVESWETKSQEAVYFLLVHVAFCYAIPFILITICNVFIWKTVLESDDTALISSTPQLTSGLAKPDFRKTQHQRKLRVLKIFTAINLAFFLFWLPLYVIMARVKFFQSDDPTTASREMGIISILVPLAQLLGSCNSCINPVLYAFLSHKFRESFKVVFGCGNCAIFSTNSVSGLARVDKYSVVRIEESKMYKATAV